MNYYDDDAYWRMRNRLSEERRDHRETRFKLARARDDLDAANTTNAALQQSVNELSARLDNEGRTPAFINYPVPQRKTLKPAQPPAPFALGDEVWSRTLGRTVKVINLRFEKGQWEVFLWGLSTWHPASLFDKITSQSIHKVGDRVRLLNFPAAGPYEIYMIKTFGGTKQVYLTRVDTGQVLDYPYTPSVLVKDS